MDKHWFSVWGEVKTPVQVQETNNKPIFNNVNGINEDVDAGLGKGNTFTVFVV